MHSFIPNNCCKRGKLTRRLLSLVFLFALSFLPSEVSAKHGKVWKWYMLHKARTKESAGKYEKSAKYLNRILEVDTGHFRANYEMGVLYLYGYDHRDEAGLYLRRALRHMPQDTVIPLFWYLGNALQYEEKYEDALQAFQTYSRLTGGSSRLTSQEELAAKIQQCNYAIQLRKEQELAVRVKNLGSSINSNWAEYVPVPDRADTVMLYTARRSSNTGGRVDWADDKYYEDMYISRGDSGRFEKGIVFKPGQKFVGSLINTRDHEAVVSLSHDQSTLVVFSDNRLWFCLRDSSGNWTRPSLYGSEINCGTYQPHGTFSPDGKRFYFSSNVEGGQGGLDIYYTEKLDGGGWSKPINAGAEINTAADEDSPQTSTNGKLLYFSSRGHQNIGGYDMFYCEKDSATGSWSKPSNLGFPYNSPGDDIFFVPDTSGTQGYFSSFRYRGFGDMDVYRFQRWDFFDESQCTPFTNTIFKIHLNAEAGIDPFGRALIYRWDMGDGREQTGAEFDYIYPRSDTYRITLSVVDSATGVVEWQEDEKEIVFPKKNHIELVAPDTACVDSIVLLDASYCYIQNSQFIRYYWKTGGKIAMDSVWKKTTFNQIGSQFVQLQLLAVSSDSSELVRYCCSKTIAVLSAADYAAYLRRKQRGDLPYLADAAGNGNVGDDSLVGNEIPVGGDSSAKAGDLVFALQPIFYDFDKSNIRSDAQKTLDSNIRILLANPDLRIKVVAHADARGNDAYNIALSARRAQAAIDYLVAHGVSRTQIVAVVAVGEREPVNNCKDDVDCTEKNHQLNRRADFFLIK
jgi:outer membrane protein OmpA-like peptidoglycan-associated protein